LDYNVVEASSDCNNHQSIYHHFYLYLEILKQAVFSSAVICLHNKLSNFKGFHPPLVFKKNEQNPNKAENVAKYKAVEAY